MKKNILVLYTLFLVNSVYGQSNTFDFNNTNDSCSGTGTFQQQIVSYDTDKNDDVFVGKIPKGIIGLQVDLVSSNDTDLRLYGQNDDKIIHWPYGLHSHGSLDSVKYQNTTIIYSGYNGVDGDSGKEFISIKETTPVDMSIRIFGYKPGYATINYSWQGKENCTQDETNNEKEFTKKVTQNSLTSIGVIPANIPNLEIYLYAKNDLDIQLFDKNGKAIVAWKTGILHNSYTEDTNYHGMTIEWSGYNGTNGKKGNEYIKITGMTTESLTMKLFAYQAGEALVKYSWGEKNNNINNKDQLCNSEYSPICGTTNLCPPGAYCYMEQINTTYINKCELEKAYIVK